MPDQTEFTYINLQMANMTTKELRRPFTVPLKEGDPEAKREEIRQYFHETFDAYEILFETLASDEAFFCRADPLRHPLIFYYGHTATFFLNKLLLGKFLTPVSYTHLTLPTKA